MLRINHFFEDAYCSPIKFQFNYVSQSAHPEKSYKPGKNIESINLLVSRDFVVEINISFFNWRNKNLLCTFFPSDHPYSVCFWPNGLFKSEAPLLPRN